MATLNQFTQTQASIIVAGNVRRTNFTFVTGNILGGITFGWTATANRILVIAAFKKEGSSISSIPAGYTKFAEIARGGVSANVTVLAKVADGTETSATGFFWPDGSPPDGYAVFEYEGVVWPPTVSSRVPVDAYVGQSITIPNNSAGVVLGIFFGAPQTGTGTPDSGWTEMVDSLTNGNFPQIYIEEKLFAAGSGTITPSFTNSTGSDYPGSVSLALSGGSVNPNQFTQTQASIVIIGGKRFTQAQGFILFNGGSFQSQATIKLIPNQFTQAQGFILFNGASFQAQAYVKATSRNFWQAQGSIITGGTNQYTQSQANIKIISRNFWQTESSIKRTNRNFTQAQARILFFGASFQAQARIIYLGNSIMQAMASLSNRKPSFQAQAQIIVRSKQSWQAMACITNRKTSWQAQAYILSQRYLVKYNNYQLPGYVQEEAIDSAINVETMGSPFMDTGFSDYTGLENKLLSLTILVTGSTYLECKNEIQVAATELRSQPKTFAPLYVQNYHKHYDAWVKTVKLEADVKTNKSAKYTVEFACKPWLYSDTQTVVSGLSLIETTGRDIYDGGWTPINLRLSGTNITVSGHTSTGEFTGFLSVSGGVTGLSVDTERYTVEMNALNRLDLVRNEDFRMFVGPGVTYFTVNGATMCEISYNDRWYL